MGCDRCLSSSTPSYLSVLVSPCRYSLITSFFHVVLNLRLRISMLTYPSPPKAYCMSFSTNLIAPVCPLALCLHLRRQLPHHRRQSRIPCHFQDRLHTSPTFAARIITKMKGQDNNVMHSAEGGYGSVILSMSDGTFEKKENGSGRVVTLKNLLLRQPRNVSKSLTNFPPARMFPLTYLNIITP
jgi:hypothetical protein